jgi:hypothetical protein
MSQRISCVVRESLEIDDVSGTALTTEGDGERSVAR